jgi:hypothetical protein
VLGAAYQIRDMVIFFARFKGHNLASGYPFVRRMAVNISFFKLRGGKDVRIIRCTAFYSGRRLFTVSGNEVRRRDCGLPNFLLFYRIATYHFYSGFFSPD